MAATEVVTQMASGDIQTARQNSVTTDAKKCSSLSVGAQQTLLKFLSRSEESPMVDRYAQLRSLKLHVYSALDLQSAQPLRREYLQFWNEESLSLVKGGMKKRSSIEATVKKNWNLNGRFVAYIKVGKDIAHLHSLDGDWDSRYKVQYEAKMTQIQRLEADRAKVQAEMLDRMKRKTISNQDKQAAKKHVESLDKDIAMELATLNKISRNWNNILNKTHKNGQRKGKRGRKPTAFQKKMTRMDSVQFQTAKELKQNTSIVHSHATQSDRRTSVPKSLKHTNTPRAFDVEKKKLETFETSEKLLVCLPEVCQYLSGPEKGSSACCGISLLTAQSFLSSDFPIGKNNTVSTRNKYKSLLQRAVNYWNENKLASMTVAQALSCPPFQTLKNFKMEEVFWHTHLKVDGFSDAVDAVLSHYATRVDKNHNKMAAVFTIHPDKTFVVLVDKSRNQLLLDSHIHFTAIENEQNFQQAFARNDCQGMMVYATKHQAAKLARFIVEQVVLELRASSHHGSIAFFKPAKN